MGTWGTYCRMGHSKRLRRPWDCGAGLHESGPFPEQGLQHPFSLTIVTYTGHGLQDRDPTRLIRALSSARPEHAEELILGNLVLYDVLFYAVLWPYEARPAA